MRNTVIFGLAFVTLLVGSDLDAQQRARRGPGGQALSSVQVLLDRAGELDLTDPQIQAMNELQEAAGEKAAPTMEALEELRSERGARPQRDQVRPLMEELRAINQEAEASALALLESQQRERAEEILEEHRREMRQRRSPRP
jgi:hypothetical protein